VNEGVRFYRGLLAGFVVVAPFWVAVGGTLWLLLGH
jgi:hypothetical protein